MDAGCGSGLLTKQLAKQVPRGKVYAVDIDSNMINQAKNNLQLFDNIEIIQSSFTDIKLPRKIDIIFSNAALHWVQDHRKAFQNFWEMLKPMKDSNDITDTSVSGNSNNNTAADGELFIQQAKDYYSYNILYKITSFFILLLLLLILIPTINHIYKIKNQIPQM